MELGRRAADDEGIQGRAFLHIGTHKTGTTAFQRWAFAERCQLARATGIRYYDGLFGPSHYEIPMLCLRTNRSMPMRAKTPDWCLDEWQREAENHIRQQVAQPAQSLLISAEAMSYIRHADEVERLVDLLYPRQISVIVALRDPASFLRSYRQTMVDLGFPPSPYRESFAYVADDSWLVDYPALLGVYREGLGADRVFAVDYERALERDGSIIPGIIDACGVDRSRIPTWEGIHLNVNRVAPGSPPKRIPARD